VLAQAPNVVKNSFNSFLDGTCRETEVNSTILFCVHFLLHILHRTYNNNNITSLKISQILHELEVLKISLCLLGCSLWKVAYVLPHPESMPKCVVTIIHNFK
jgi:hypothetical protein